MPKLKYLLNTVVGAALVIPAAVSAVHEPGKADSAYTESGANFEEVLYSPDQYIGSSISWGGNISDVVRTKKEIQVTVQQTPLDDVGLPRSGKYSQGWFIARVDTNEWVDSIRIGVPVIIEGEIVDSKTRPLGKDDQYTYPVIDAQDIFICYQKGNLSSLGEEKNPYGVNGEKEPKCYKVEKPESIPIEELKD